VDSAQFDAFTRRISSQASRRSLLTLGGVGVLAATLGLDSAAAKCAKPGNKCGKGKKCCAGAQCKGKKKKKRCTCPAGTQLDNGACVPIDVECLIGEELVNGVCVPIVVECAAGQKECRGECVAQDSCCAGNQLETVFVPVTGGTRNADTVAEAGDTFLFRVSNTFASNAIRCDAEFCFTPSSPQDNFDRCDDANGTSVDVAVLVNGESPGWGAFNTDHIYEATVTFDTAGLMRFGYSDCEFTGNVGFLPLAIFPCL
jgi:hypothetical protein